jgi:protein-S-isoprenylcysteine O-methyltransferase Ste14
MALVFAAAVVASVVIARIDGRGTALLTSSELWGVRPLFLATGLLCIAAFALRVWSEALLGTVVYGQEASTDVVARGPFAVTRNPLYIGTWLFFVGSTGPYLPPLVLCALALAFVGILRAIVVDEEAALSQKIGARFAAYCDAVPRFVGRVRPFSSAVRTPAMRDVAWGLLSNLFLLTLGAYRVAWAITGTASKLLGVVNIAGLVVWLVVVLARRSRG